jgi:class 3 adenylate cyclase
MRALLVIPLIVDQHPIGALSIDSLQEHAFEMAHRRILSILASQAAVAVIKSRLFAELERNADREKWSVRGLFQRYVSPAIVKRLVEGEQDLSLGGKRQQVSVLFADIRGFTTLGENLAPERLIEVLNQYLALAVDAILVQEGTLDKFMGDGVMALFNAPLPCPDHTLRAVRAAWDMQRAIAEYNIEGTSHAPLSFGVGIHVGQAVVGNVGTVQQMNYTAIGDAVNLSKRLQEHASGGQIILSQATYEALKKDVIVQDLGPLAVKGRVATEHAYSLLGLVQDGQD